MYQAPSIVVRVTYPGTQTQPSLFDVNVLSQSVLNPLYPTGGTTYAGFCLDIPSHINVPGTYTSFEYSSYELGVLQANSPIIGSSPYLANLDNINWLLNFYTGTGTGYTWGEVQSSIWRLLGQDYSTEVSYLGPVDPSHVNTLTQAALAHDGYVPQAGQTIGVIIDPVDGSGTHLQPLILETQAAALGDFVFVDKNADGLQQTGEPGIAGVTVNLVRDLNNDGVITPNEVLASTVTDASGHYSFIGLTPGLNYQVQFTQPAAYDGISPRQADGSATSGSNSDGLLSNVVVLAPGENNVTLDAGFYQSAKLGDRVWYDTNGNGVQDAGEGNAVGVTVNLLDNSGNVVATQVTNATGNYLFSNLTPGSYSVQFVAPSGYTFTGKNAGTDITVDSDADTVTGKTGSYTLSSGDVNLTADAGLVAVPPVKAHFGDFVFLDANANGIQDAGETGIAGLQLNVTDASGNLVGSTTTDATGHYGFDVAPGTYTVWLGANGYVNSPTFQGGNTALDSNFTNIAGTPVSTATVTVAAGDNNLTIDAGLYKLAQLGDRVWYDANGNGIQDAGETGAAGVLVTLKTGSTVLATQTTDANGNYLFTGLAPGSYNVLFGTLAGYTFTTKGAGSNTAIDSDANTSGQTINYTLSAGGSNLTVDAGLVSTGPQKAHLGDFVWLDSNANGIQDSGEAGIAGVTVNLLNTASSVVATTTTDSTGHYGFDVAPGTYAVQFVTPSGYVNSAVNQGSNSGLDSDYNPTIGKTQNYTLHAGDNNLTVDAGLYKLASLGDFIWYDTNKNGIQDSGEAGVTGVKVDLYFGSTKISTATTDSTGHYLFSGLTPGDYHIGIQQSTLPANYTFTTQHAGSNNKVDSDADSNGVMATTTLTSGENDLSWDAGIVSADKLTGQIGDLVWRDHNEDGIQAGNATEPGIPGVHVSLYTSAGVLVAKQDTDSTGHYLFKNLAAGDYYVQFDKTNVTYNAPSPNPGTFTLNTWYFAQKNVGSNDNIDSDAGSSSGKTLVNVAKTDVFHLNAGQIDLSHDAGLTPLVINLDGQGIQTTSRLDSTGTFDLLGNGHAVNSGWITSGSAFLAVDSNGNGKIDSVNELFGGLNQGDAYAKLATFDTNHDGVIDARDADFSKLLIWRDLNGDHQSDPGELMTLAQAGIASLSLNHSNTMTVDAQGNVLGESSRVTMTNGSTVGMTDVYFNVAATDTAAAGVTAPTINDLLGNDRALDTLLGSTSTNAQTAVHTNDTAAISIHSDVTELLRHLAAQAHDSSPHLAMM